MIASIPIEGSPAWTRSLRKKVAWRLLPLVLVLYIVCYLDRANIGFAKLRMAKDLKFSEEVFGLGIGIFFIGYLALEIPGALLVERWSARKWFARILVTWGVISALTAFVRTPMEFYAARFLLGVAEAGFFPGIIVYLSHWFAKGDRSRALAGLIMAGPFSLALGAPISAVLLDVHWFHLLGWQWLFLLEGLPSILLSGLTLLWLTDRPRDAGWLTAAEREHLERTLAEEEREKAAPGKIAIWQTLRLPKVWILSAGIFAANTGGYALAFWLPTMIKKLSGGSDRATLWYSCLYYCCALISVFVSGQSSDRSGERKWHCAGGLMATGVVLAISTISGQSFPLVMMWLCLTAFAGSFWSAPFWTLPSLTLNAGAAAVAIGFINMWANISGYFGNHATGWLRDHGFGVNALLLCYAFCYALGGILISCLKISPPPRAPLGPV